MEVITAVLSNYINRLLATKYFFLRAGNPPGFVLVWCLPLQQLVAFWSFGSVCPSPLPHSTRLPLVSNSRQTAKRSCQLWWEAGDCSVPAPKSERLCLAPPCRAELHWERRCLPGWTKDDAILLSCLSFRLNPHLLVTFIKDYETKPRELLLNAETHSKKTQTTPSAGHKGRSYRRRKQLRLLWWSDSEVHRLRLQSSKQQILTQSLSAPSTKVHLVHLTCTCERISQLALVPLWVVAHHSVQKDSFRH